MSEVSQGKTTRENFKANEKDGLRKPQTLKFQTKILQWYVHNEGMKVSLTKYLELLTEDRPISRWLRN